MGFRNLIFMKRVVVRSCVRQAAVQPVAEHVLAAAGKAKLGPLLPPFCASTSLLHTRCLSVFPTNLLCKTLTQQNNITAHRTVYPVVPTWQSTCQSTCQHLRYIHLSGQHCADDKTDAKQTEITEEDDPLVAKYDEDGKPLSNWKRMKMMMKAYGYVIIPVHWVIAPVWFGAFYYVIKMGVDIGPMLLKIGVSEHHVHSLQNSGASNALMAYALYKIFTPLRYTVTLGTTEMTIRYLRRHGYIKTPPPKEKSYRESLQETVSEMKDKAQDVRDKAQDFKDKAQEKVQDFKDKAQDIRDKRKE